MNFEVSEKRWAVLIGTDGKIEKTLRWMIESNVSCVLRMQRSDKLDECKQKHT